MTRSPSTSWAPCHRLFTGLLALGALSVPALAQKPAPAKAPTIQDAYRAHGIDLKVYDEHLTFLASPFLEGRLPGTQGMEIAKNYVQHFYQKAGLVPAFEGGKSWRQAFPLRGVASVTKGVMKLGDRQLLEGTDFNILSLGSGGTAKGELVFVGYGLRRGRNNYEGFNPDDDLSGKIAVVLRYEPIDENGKSRWTTRGRWSTFAGFASKMRSLTTGRRNEKSLNPAGIIFINPPGADDPRIAEMMDAASGGRSRAQLPVAFLSNAQAEALIQRHDPKGRSLTDLRKLADEGRTIVPLGVEGHIEAELGRKGTNGENVGGLLLGKGALADEVVVVGAHLDHLGMGQFGSRSGPGELHPGADDNASGVAAILMIADKLAQQYREMPEGASARSVLFLAFSGEESGLNGSRFYTRNPIRPIDQHAIMLNFDMIGRIQDGGLSLSGTGSAKGMMEWLQPIVDKSPLNIKPSAGVMAASDHYPFYQARVPVLFAIVSPLHADYHTPRDTADKINRVDAVHAMRLFRDIAAKVATIEEPIEYSQTARGNRPRQAGSGDQRPRMRLNVRFGIMPGSYESDAKGVLVGDVTSGGSAEKGGIEAGDRMVKWNGKAINDVRDWMTKLMQHKPGDKVKVTVLRDGKQKELTVELQGR